MTAEHNLSTPPSSKLKCIWGHVCHSSALADLQNRWHTSPHPTYISPSTRQRYILQYSSPKGQKASQPAKPQGSDPCSSSKAVSILQEIRLDQSQDCIFRLPFPKSQHQWYQKISRLVMSVPLFINTRSIKQEKTRSARKTHTDVNHNGKPKVCTKLSLQPGNIFKLFLLQLVSG